MKELLILLFTISFVHSAKCEIWPVYSILDLCLISDEVVEAKFLEENQNNYIFITKEFGSKGQLKDTFVFERFHGLILKDPDTRFPTTPSRPGEERTIEPVSKRYLDIEDLKSSSNIILFLKNNSEGSSYPLLGGYRVIYKNLLYSPMRMHTNDRYIFLKTEISQEKIFNEIETAQKKTMSIKSILNRENGIIQRIKYRFWIYRNKDEFNIKTSINSSDGWGVIGRFYENRLKNKGIKPEDIEISVLQEYLKRT